MKKNILYGLFLLMGISFVFSACEDEEDDKGKKLTGNAATNQWIDNTMRSWYLWNDEIPETNKLDFDAEPENFFFSLLSLKDGKSKESGHRYYSTIKKKSVSGTRGNLGETPTLGFEFQWWTFTNTGMSAVNVLYVLPNSPAADAGIRRGDWIQEINGSGINSTSIRALQGANAVELKIAKKLTEFGRKIVLTPRRMDDNPVYLDTVYTFGYQVKIGYLVYNHFTSGPDGSGDEIYNNSMRRAFTRFKEAGVNEFVLDLRYNGGGLVSCAQLLATMLAPASCLGNADKPFCLLEFNKNHSSQNNLLTFDQKFMNKGVGGANLNLPRLFVLTSSWTASASEAVVNGLRPFCDVILVGEQTEGKNVGSITIEDSKYKYELHPIVSRIFNAKGESNYANGFTPDYLIENEPIMNNGQLGDYFSDVMLSYTLYYILQGSWPERTRSAGTEAVSNFNSLDSKKLNGVLLN